MMRGQYVERVTAMMRHHIYSIISRTEGVYTASNIDMNRRVYIASVIGMRSSADRYSQYYRHDNRRPHSQYYRHKRGVFITTIRSMMTGVHHTSIVGE